MASGYKVLISGISPTIPQDVLISTLLKFGDMVTMFFNEENNSNGMKSGYVVYKTKLECYLAISGLNEQPPYYLSMQFGDTVVKDESSLEIKPEFLPRHCSPASGLYRKTQTQHTNIESQRMFRGTCINWEQVFVRKVVENQGSSLIRGKEVVVGSTATGDQPEACEFGYGVQASRNEKMSAFIGSPNKIEDRCLYCKKLGDELCEECGVTYCSRKCQSNDWNRHKHECKNLKRGGKVSSPGAETLIQKKNSTSQNKENSLCRKPVEPKQQRLQFMENQDSTSGDLFEVNDNGALVNEGSKIFTEKKLIRKSRECHDKMARNSTPPREGIERRKSVESDLVIEGKDEHLKHPHPKNGLIKSCHLDGSQCDEVLKGACCRRVMPCRKATKLVSGIGRGVIVCNNLELSSTIIGGNACEYISGGRSGNQHDEFTLNDGSNSSSDQVIEEQVFQKSVSTKRRISQHTSPLQRKLEKLFVLQNQQKKKNEVKTGHLTEPTANLSKELRPVNDEDSNILGDKNYLPEAASEESPKAEKDIWSPKITKLRRVSPLPENVRKLDLDTIQGRKNYIEDVRENDMKLQSDVLIKVEKDISSPKVTTLKRVSPLPESVRKLDLDVIQGRINYMKLQSDALSKVHKLPAAGEISKPMENQEQPDTNAANSTKVQWDLFSDDPKTQIVNYDLCTQQKKLSSDVFSPVDISTLLSPGDYWVQSIDKEELGVIQNLIRNKRKTSQAPFNPSLGGYCCVFHSDSWYRAKILSIKEKEIVALLIDYGKIICAEAELLEELPQIAKSFYAQATHVKVDPRTPADCLNCEEGDILVIKACGTIQEGVTKVQLLGELYAQEVAVPKKLSLDSVTVECEGNETSGTTQRVQWPPSALSLLKEGVEVSCTVLDIMHSEEEDRDEAIVVIAFESITDDLESIAEDLPDDCMEKPEDSEFNPSVGDLVAAFSNKLNYWVRSVVLDAGCRCWLVACFDFGFVEEVTKICDIPDDKKYRKALALSAEFCVTKSLFPREDLFCEGRIECNAALCAKILKKKDDCLECDLGPDGDQTFCSVTLRAWSPKPDCSAHATLSDKKILPWPTLDVVKLTPKCTVKIVSYFESLVINVQPCDNESKLLMEELHCSITNAAVKNGALKEDPIKGKKYICRYAGDMKYYRAVVNRVKSLTKIHVTYLDYGNDEIVPKGRMYELPPELEKIPCYAVKVELKKEFNKKLNLEAQKYMSFLISENKKMVLNYSDGNLRSAELLINNISLSNILKRLIDP